MRKVSYGLKVCQSMALFERQVPFSISNREKIYKILRDSFVEWVVCEKDEVERI